MRALIALLAGLAATAAHAADLAPPATEPIAPEAFESRWNGAFGAYVWAAGLSGDVGVRGREPVNVDVSFGDILEDLDVAFMAAGEVRYDRFGVFTDLFYTRVTGKEDILRGLGTAKVTTKTLAATLMAEARVVEQGNSSLDLMAGARLWSIGGELDIDLPRRSIERDQTRTWVDPMIGVKARVQGSWPVYATAIGMVGGFGAGSDIDWDVLAGIGYEINKRVSIIAGYRAVGVDYRNDGFVYDTVLHGPLISGVIHF